MPVAPVPSCAVKLPILLGSVDLISQVFPNRLVTRSLRLLDLTSLPATALACAPHEVPEAHWLGFPLSPPGFDCGGHCIGLE